MADYTVEARPRVRKTLRQLDPTVRKDVLAKMRTLATDPRPSGTKPLRGHPPWLRVRAGDYRIIYSVDDDARVVTVASVGHRREVYRNLGLKDGLGHEDQGWIWLRAAFAEYESIRKLIEHGHTSFVGAGIAGAVLGIIGNLAVARYKMVVGRRINSATLMA